DLAVRVSRGAGAGEVVKPDLFRLLPGDVRLRGREAEVGLELPETAWAGLPAGTHAGGQVKVKPPWLDWKDAPGVDVVVHKLPYRVSARPLTFDFSGGRKEQRQEVVVRLDTRLDTTEPVWLSTAENREAAPGTKLLLVPAGSARGK